MATNTKNKEWAKSQKDMLVEMVNKGYIDIEDIKAINNKDNAYSIGQQDAAFERVKNDIQKRYSEDRLNSDDAKSVLSEDQIKQFRTFRESVDKFDKPTDALLSSKLSEQIKSSGYKDLPLLKGMTKQIKNLSDEDVKEYIYNQRAYLNQSLPTKVIESIPDLQEYMTVQPNYGVKNTDYAKMFNDPDILDKLDEYSFRDIDYIARKNGMSGKELLKDLTDAKVAKDRESIAHGRWRSDASIPENIANEVGGTLLTLFGRRQQDAIARGEEPELKDIAGDVGEQLAYTLPVGRVVGPAAKIASKIGPHAAKVVSTAANVGSNAIVPTATELYDTMVYDNENPRGSFSPVDVAFGSGVNIAGPLGIKKLGNIIGRLLGSKDIVKTWGELAEGKTKDEILKDIQSKYKGVKIRDADNPNVSAEVRKKAQEFKSLLASDPDIEKTLAQKEPIIFDIAREEGNTLEDKAKNYVARNYPEGYTIVDVDGVANKPTVSDLYKLVAESEGTIHGNPELTTAGKVGKFSHGILAEYEANPNVLSSRMMSVYDKLGLDAVESAKTLKELRKEERIKNYLTNQFGNATYGDENVSLPIAAPLNYFGIDINQLLKDKRANDKRKKAEEKSRKKLPTLQSVYGNIIK